MKLSNVVYAVCVALFAFLIARIFGSMIFLFKPYLYVVFSAVVCITFYFPFTPKAFHLWELPPKQRLISFLKRIGIFNLILAGIVSLPLLCFITKTGCDVFAGLGTAIALYTLVAVVVTEIFLIIVITVAQFITKRSLLGSCASITFVLAILVFFNFNAQLIPVTSASIESNRYFESTGQCSRLSEYEISYHELFEYGCSDFAKYDKQGVVKDIYKNVAKINAYKRCYIQTERPYGVSILTNVDCAIHEGKEGVFVDTTNDHELTILREKSAAYKFDENANFYTVCKTVLADVIREQKNQCVVNKKPYLSFK